MPAEERGTQPHPVRRLVVCRTLFVFSLAFLNQGLAMRPKLALPPPPLYSLSLPSARMTGLYRHIHSAETFVKSRNFFCKDVKLLLAVKKEGKEERDSFIIIFWDLPDSDLRRFGFSKDVKRGIDRFCLNEGQ